jgi:integrase
VRPDNPFPLLTSEAVLAWAERYRPSDQSLRRRWEEDELLRAFVAHALLSLGDLRRPDVYRSISVLTRFVVHCQDAGIGLEPSKVFTFTNAESYLSSLSATQVNTHRTTLQQVADALGLAVRDALPSGRVGLRPRPMAYYTEDDLDALLGTALTQSTALRRRYALTMLSVCHGSGGHGADVVWMQRQDVRVEGSTVAIEYGAPRGRMVPVLRRYHAILLELCEGLDEDDYLCGSVPTPITAATQMARRLDDPHGRRGGPRFRAQTLRDTWALTMVQRAIPVTDLLAALGSDRGSTVSRLAASLPAGDPMRSAALFQEDRR